MKNKFFVTRGGYFISLILFLVILIGSIWYAWPVIDQYGILTVLIVVNLGPFLLVVCQILMNGPRITIDERGIHKALFKVFFKKEILWNEVAEIRILRRRVNFICFSKESLNDDTDMKSANRFLKNGIYLDCTQKVLIATKYYTNKKIIGYDEEKKAA